MNLDREAARFLIETSQTDEEADKVIEDIFKFDTVKEKIAFLKGMFGVRCVGHDIKDEATYYAMLNTIIDRYKE